MISKPFKSENKELNKLIDWIIRNFAERDNRIVIEEMRSLSDEPARDMQDRELRIRDNDGTKQLVIKYNNQLIVFDED